MALTIASNQWSTRPDDQRYWDLKELDEAVKGHRAAARTASVPMTDLRVEVVNDDLQLAGRSGSAQLSHWAFGQLCTRAYAPAGYLRSQPATLAAQNLNWGLKQNSEQSNAQLLFHQNGGYLCRSLTTEKYSRLWNYLVVKKLMELEQDGWTVAPAFSLHNKSERTRIATATQAALSLNVKAGDVIGPAGLYASFEDLFVFMVHPQRIIRDGSPNGLMRGFCLWNSEVGKLKIGIQTFYFRVVCGNHMIWDAQDVKEMSFVHRGDIVGKFDSIGVDLKKYADQSTAEEEAKVQATRSFVLKGRSREDVLGFIFNLKLLTRKDAVASYEAVVPEIDGPAYTAYGFAQGVTRLSQREPNADSRVVLDRAAGQVLSVAF